MAVGYPRMVVQKKWTPCFETAVVKCFHFVVVVDSEVKPIFVCCVPY